MARKRMTPNQFEIEGLRELCKENDCDMKMLIDAFMSNIVGEEISKQIYFLKTGKIPGEE